MDNLNFLVNQVFTLFAKPQWNKIISSLLMGRTVDIMGSLRPPALFFSISQSIDEINCLVNAGGVYVASMKYSPQHECMTPAELRIYLMQSLVNSVSDGSIIIDKSTISSRRML